MPADPPMTPDVSADATQAARETDALSDLMSWASDEIDRLRAALTAAETQRDAALALAGERPCVAVQALEDTMSGELCFSGQNTRIPVRCVLSFVRAGYASQSIRVEYPTLSLLEIEAAAALVAKAEGRALAEMAGGADG